MNTLEPIQGLLALIIRSEKSSGDSIFQKLSSLCGWTCEISKSQDSLFLVKLNKYFTRCKHVALRLRS